MMALISSFTFLFILYLFFIFFLKKKYLQSKYNSKHQKLVGKESIPLIGGILFFFHIISNYSLFDNSLIIFSFPILFIGILSDINYLNSPNKRLILQFLTICIFLIFFDYRISDLRIDLLDFIFLDTYFKFFFTAFCILILINGSNFIDGSNGLNLGYFSIVLCIIQILISDNIIDVKNDSILICLIGIIFLLILNYFNFLYLGDSGAYIISFVVGSLLIYIYQNNPNISPYFIALILWYPAFENFFSIIRKKISKISTIDPDTNHLHHLIFKFLLRQNFFFKKYSNQLTSTLIVLYNLIIFLIAINYVSETNESILLIILNIIVYLSIYTYLKNKLSIKR